MDHSVIVAALTIPGLYTALLMVDRVLVAVPGVLGVYVGLRNQSNRRATRGGVFQRHGDVKVKSSRKSKSLTRSVSVAQKQHSGSQAAQSKLAPTMPSTLTVRVEVQREKPATPTKVAEDMGLG